MKLQDDFKAFVDGEVGLGLNLRIKTHLAETPEDQKVVDELQLLSKSIREYVTQPEPVGLEATLAALETAKPVARKAMMFRQQMAWVGGALACVLLIGFVGPWVSGGDARLMAKAAPSFTTRHWTTDDGPATGTTGSSPATAPADLAKNESVVAQGAMPMPGAETAKSLPDTENRDVASADSNSNSNGNTLRQDRGQWNGAAGSAATPAPKPESGELDSAGSSRAASGRMLKQPMIQRDASLSLNVKKVSDAQHIVEQITAGLGGYVSQSSRAEAKDEDATASMTLRIPGPHFEDALKEIQGLGEVVSESASGLDVTSQVVDMDARVKVLKAEESDYVILLGRNSDPTAQIIEIKDKLTDIREEIESIGSQEATLKDQVQYSTINLTLSQAKSKTPGGDVKEDKPKPDTWLTDTWTSAIDGLGTVAKALAQLLIFTLVWLPIWLPLSLLGAWAYRKMKW